MSKNQNIVSVIKKYVIILVFFCCFEALFYVILNTVVRRFLIEGNIENQTVGTIIFILNIFITVISLTIDILFVRKIIRIKPLVYITPQKCFVEDFIVTTHRQDGDKKYNIYLLLRNSQNNELLFTYNEYSLSFINYTYSQMGRSLQGINIFRKDGSFVKIGDEVYVYIKKYVNVNVSYKEDAVKLNNRKFEYKHMNTDFDNKIFQKVRFYEGAVDVERKLK